MHGGSKLAERPCRSQRMSARQQRPRKVRRLGGRRHRHPLSDRQDVEPSQLHTDCRRRTIPREHDAGHPSPTWCGPVWKKGCASADFAKLTPPASISWEIWRARSKARPICRRTHDISTKPWQRTFAVTEKTIVDAGPLVAFLNRRDAHPGWARAEFGRRPAPLYTCEAVLYRRNGRQLIPLVTPAAVAPSRLMT